MGLLELFILAVGVSMDVCAVAICKGLALPRVTVKNSLWLGLWFGLFQGLVPLIGCLLGAQFMEKPPPFLFTLSTQKGGDAS